MGVLGRNRGRGGAILTLNELVLTFRGSYVCANFDENRSRNATVRVLADGQTHRQTQTDFIICPMLYAVAMGQIITKFTTRQNNTIHCTSMVSQSVHEISACKPRTVQPFLVAVLTFAVLVCRRFDQAP